MSATYLPAAVALVLIVLAGAYAEGQGRALASLAERGAVAERLGLVGARLDSALSVEATSTDRLSAAAALSAAVRLDPDLDLALAAGPTFGDPTVLEQHPVTTHFVVPGGTWTLSAVPRGGWSGGAAAHWPIRIATLLASALIVVPMLRTRWLVEERQRNIDALGSREAELERLSRRLDLALDASKVGVWDFNIDTDVLVWDERQNELYGYMPGHPRSYVDWRDRLHPDDLARAEAEFREAIEVTGRYVSDYRLVLPGGAVRHIRAIGAVYREVDGSSRIVGVNWGVTADVQRNQELDAKRRDAEGASSAKSQFLATMSHEIRTPMNGVLGMLDLILRGETDPAQRERATIARDCARHLLAIVNDILDLSKLEANRITLTPAPADVHALAADVVALMATGVADRDIDVSASVGPDVPRTLFCDATRLRQVLMNLVGNAVKFTETGAVAVTLGYRPQDGRLEVAVRDTGVGIPEEAKRLLFERFAQVESPMTRQRGGTGLGLAISRQLVELMGGEIAVESVAGLGSTFRFWIPAPPAAGLADPGPAAPLHLPPARVLVAEDNPTNRQILAAYLAMAGHAAEMVTNGLEALAAARDGAFDLVIMDVHMPVLDGLAATARIRALEGPAAAIPIIALTASAMDGDREHCLAAGMTEYVTKPVSLEALCAAMARCLAYGASGSTGDQASPGSKLSMAPAASSVASPRSAS
jgi:signal transduction histidine kinase/DNA-binding NarL/FixJ family response regulator